MYSCLFVRNWHISSLISSSNFNQHRRFLWKRQNHHQIQINIVTFHESDKIIIKFKSTSSFFKKTTNKIIVKFKSTSSLFKETTRSSSNSNQHRRSSKRQQTRSSSNSNQHRHFSEKQQDHRQIQINIVVFQKNDKQDHRQIQINIVTFQKDDKIIVKFKSTSSSFKNFQKNDKIIVKFKSTSSNFNETMRICFSTSSRNIISDSSRISWLILSLYCRNQRRFSVMRE